MENEKQPQSDLEDQDATELPDREAMSIIDPGKVGGILIPTIPTGGSEPIAD